MRRLLQIATATLAVFHCCSPVEGGLTLEVVTVPEIQDTGFPSEASSVVSTWRHYAPSDETTAAMEGFDTLDYVDEKSTKGNEVVELQETRVPPVKLSGLKTTVLGVILLLITLLIMSILANSPRDTKLFEATSAAMEYIDSLLPEKYSHEHGVYVREFIPMAGLFLAASGIAHLIKSFIERYRVRRHTYGPPVKGLEFTALGLLVVSLALVDLLDPQLLTVGLPSLIVGISLNLSSLVERRMYLKEQRDHSEKFTGSDGLQ